MEDVLLVHSHVSCLKKRQGNAKLRMIVYAPHGIQMKFWEEVSLLILKNGPRALKMPPQALFLIIHALFPILVYLFIYFLLMSVKETYSLFLVQLVCSG